MGKLHLALLGSPEVYHAPHPAPAAPTLTGDNSPFFATRKTLALLIYLAVEAGHQPRERITTLLWPDSNNELGRTSLRKTLGYLRQALGEKGEAASNDVTPHLLAGRDAIALNRDTEISAD